MSEGKQDDDQVVRGSGNVLADQDATVEFEARSKAVRFAVANTVIEGGHVLPETEELMNEWARGDIDDHELIEEALKRFGPGA